MLLGCVLALLVTLVSARVSSPAAGRLASERLAAAQVLATTPVSSENDNRCTLASEGIDVDDDESGFTSDDAPPGDLASALAIRFSAASRVEATWISTLPSDTSRFTIDTGLARGPPSSGEVTLL